MRTETNRMYFFVIAVEALRAKVEEQAGKIYLDI